MGVIAGRIVALRDQLSCDDPIPQRRGEIENLIAERRVRLALMLSHEETLPVKDESPFYPIDVGGEG